MSREIMQEALDAMARYQVKSGDFDRFDDVIKNLRQALAQPEKAIIPFPSFMRKRIEQAMEDAIHPTGMSVHDGKVKVLVSDLHRMLLVVDSVLAQPEQAITPISPDQYERFCGKCGVCLGKPWVGLTDEDLMVIEDCNRGFWINAATIEQLLKDKNT